ncbi:MAG: glycerophosphodiester phosphodiesterase family protein [Bacteroidota bacterium]|nr:glycerophosphodiester phosphodiesterase family protein [Bacteroidota bacterium]
MRYLVAMLMVGIILSGCGEDETAVLVPDYDPDGRIASLPPLRAMTMQAMEGVYAVDAGRQRFGDEVVLKYAGGGLSIFSERDAVYCLLNGGRQDSTLELAGYWRRQVGVETGVLRLTIDGERGGGILQRGQNPERGEVILEGSFSSSAGQGGRPVTLTFDRPLYRAERPFLIIAHRAGGRNADRLPAAENSVELLRIAERFGANGVEIDVQLTKDGVPVIYHDEKLNQRLTQKSGLVGSVSDYTLAQLETLVRLRNGEKIPTLKRMLAAVLRQTDLRFVWLDSKESVPLALLRDVQRAYVDSARLFGRDLTIVIGLPDVDKINELLALPDFASAQVLCELDVDLVRRTHAEIWAPRWTLGTQTEAVTQMQAEGRQVLVWTLDEAAYIEIFLRDGHFDGILTNYPALLAYYYYSQ